MIARTVLALSKEGILCLMPAGFQLPMLDKGHATKRGDYKLSFLLLAQAV